MKKQAFGICAIVVSACVCMALVDVFWQPGYALRAAAKLLLFGGGLGLSVPLCGGRGAKARLFARQSLKPALLLGAGVFAVIWAAFLICRSFIDLESIAAGLLTAQNVRADNYLWVALYIALVNSGLEEVFFRGLAFGGLRTYWGDGKAAIFSSTVFALYHVSIIGTWFSWWVFGLCMLGLFLGGLIFCWLDRRGGILPSWLCHGAANLAINTIGLLMFPIF